MLKWTYTLMSNRRIKIHPSLQELIVSLRTAVVSDGWSLDKQQTSHHDTLDSLRLALCNYELSKRITSLRNLVGTLGIREPVNTYAIRMWLASLFRDLINCLVSIY